MESLKWQQRMNIIPVGLTNFFIQLSENTFRILNIDEKIMTQQRTLIPHCYNKEGVKDVQLFSALDAGSIQYIQVANKLFELRGLQLKELDKIYFMDTSTQSQLMCRCYNVAGVTFFSSGKKVYKVEQNKLLEVKKETQQKQYFSFCGHSASWNGNEILRINDDFSETLLLRGNYINAIVFAQGGVVLFQNNSRDKNTVLNLIDFTIKELNDPELTLDTIHDNLHLNTCGLSLKSEKLKKIFGEQFVTQRDETYVQWATQHKKAGIELISAIFKQYKITQIFLEPKKKIDGMNSESLPLHLHLVYHSVGKYLQYSDNHARLLNQSLKVLKTFDVDCPIFLGQRLVENPHHHSAIYFGEFIYFQVFDTIYKAKGTEVQSCATIQGLDITKEDNIHNCFYIQNGNLIVTNQKRSYTVKNDDLKFKGFETSEHIIFVQFCDKVMSFWFGVVGNQYVRYKVTQVRKLQGSFKNIKFTDQGQALSYYRFLYQFGPIAVLQHPNEKKYYIINILLQESKVTTDQDFDENNVLGILEMRVFGLSICSQKIRELFGDEFNNTLDDTFLRHINKQNQEQEVDNALMSDNDDQSQLQLEVQENLNKYKEITSSKLLVTNNLHKQQLRIGTLQNIKNKMEEIQKDDHTIDRKLEFQQLLIEFNTIMDSQQKVEQNQQFEESQSESDPKPDTKDPVDNTLTTEVQNLICKQRLSALQAQKVAQFITQEIKIK